jgi:hypothetical protein
MKFSSLLMCVAGSLFFTQLTAQRTADDIIAQKEIVAPKYLLNPGKLELMRLPMSYGETAVLTDIEREILKIAKVRQVHVVFTDHPKGADLKSLNKGRIKVVEELRKDLVSDTLVQWKIIRQTACTSEEEAKKLFHGVIILYEKETFLVERATVNNLLPKEITPKEAKRRIKKMPDTTVYNVLNEMKWKDMVVVTDFTSSMYPYSAQLVLWFAINTQQTKISDVFFFNDGDQKPNTEKINGQVGGIYHEHRVNFTDVRNLAYKTAGKGIGGEDLEENDLEALLYAMEKAPNAKGYVLIADNSAPPRDMELIDKIKKPVHIILCGTSGGFDLAYLELARKTGGSLHTMEENLNELMKLKEGQSIRVGKRIYKIIDGEIDEVVRE